MYKCSGEMRAEQAGAYCSAALVAYLRTAVMCLCEAAGDYSVLALVAEGPE